MCGIAGYIRTKGLHDESVIGAMLARIRHRGPDGASTWSRPETGLAFAHSRLKVQDLSPAAEQPMHAGGVTLIFNGEIYNFRELRDELVAAGASFTSTGDTEVLLELCRRDPELGFLGRLNGMFAFAVWHDATKTLSLARDRTGVKPLLFAPLGTTIGFDDPHQAFSPHEFECSGGLAFASEMHAIRPALESVTIDPTAVMQLLTLGFIAAPRTIFHRVRKLPPGCLLRWGEGRIRIHRWAPLEGESQFGDDAPPCSSVVSAGGVIRRIFDDAVRRRLLADVPVGVFLSGGIDSAIVTAAAARVSDTRVKTFSVSFPDEPFYDESRYAEPVARMHGTEHTPLPLSLREVQDVIPTVQGHIGEPFADSSALPTYLLSRLTRQHVTVALSGDGADELFAGYNRYAAATLIEKVGRIARTPLYGPCRAAIEALPARRERLIGGLVSQAKRAIRSMDGRLPHRFANWMRTSDDATLARLMHRQDRAPELLESVVSMLWNVRSAGEPGAGRPDKDENDLNRHLRTEWRTSLPDDMLTKIDLMSMAHGLEVRSPFLDYRLVERVFAMPWRWKLSGWRKKHLLIETFKHELPAILHNRPKKGFEVPVGPWLRGPLKGMARELIEADRCFFGSVLSREGALSVLAAHGSGRADHNFCLWALVSLLAWQQRHAPGVEAAEA